MQPDEGTKEDLVRYRLEKAKEDLASAKTLFEAKDYRGANNRAYYSIYHSISAIQGLDGNTYKRHKDAIANFNKDYVKTEIFPRTLGHKIALASEIRHASDYDDFYLATREESEQQIETAEELLQAVTEHIKSRL